MITVAELFPLYSTCYKWLLAVREISLQEVVRLEKEYTIYTKTSKQIFFDGQSSISTHERYTIDDKLHRTDEPAIVNKENGKLWNTQWFCHGVLHRINGPAVIKYLNGTEFSRTWYLYGKRGGTNVFSEVVHESLHGFFT